VLKFIEIRIMGLRRILGEVQRQCLS